MSVISFKIRGIQKVTGVVVTQNIAGQLERVPMVRVRFTSGNEITAPLVPTMQALLDLDHQHNTIEWALIRRCLDVIESARIGPIGEVMPGNKKAPDGSGHRKENTYRFHSNRLAMQKPF